MSPKKNINISMSGLLASNWIITLTATLVGVFLALYLNERVSTNKLKSKKAIAVENVLSEIESNKRSLETTNEKHLNFLEITEFVHEHMDEDQRLICSSEKLSSFRRKFPSVFSITDSIALEDNLYHYKGDLNLPTGLSQFDLTTASWDAMKNSGLSSSFDFNCLIILEQMDRLTKETADQNRYFLDMVQNQADYEVLNRQLKLLLKYEKLLLEFYDRSESEIKDCG